MGILLLHPSARPPIPRQPECLRIPQGPGMDAANPLCQWLSAAILAALIGCQTCDQVPIPTIRGQSPAPLATTPPPGPLSPAGPSSPKSPILPAAPNGPGGTVQ